MKENKCMNNNFDRLLKLSQKTKSTLVVYDRDGGEHCVILSIDEFEKMSGQAPTDTEKTAEEKGFQVPVSVLQQPVIDQDLESDEAVLEALNQKIASWRAAQPVPEPDESCLNTDSVQETPIPEESTVDHAPEEPTQSIAVPVVSASTAQTLTPATTSNKSSSWHRLGDVMAETLKPKMPEVRYEEIGEPEVALPVKQADELEGFSEPETLDDEPLFLEEPIN